MVADIGDTACLLFAEQVVVGLCDVAVAGCRALLSLEAKPGSNWTTETHDLVLKGLDGKAISILTRNGQQLQAAQLINFRGADGVLQVSLVVLSAAIPKKSQAVVCSSLLDLVSRGSTKSTSLLVAAALSLPDTSSEPFIWETSGSAVPAGLPEFKALPNSSTVKDSFLATLFHVALAKGRPTCCIAVPGRRFSEGEVQEVLQTTVRSLGEAIAEAVKMVYLSKQASEIEVARSWFEAVSSSATTGNRDNIMYL